MAIRQKIDPLAWQSKAVLLLVLPWTAVAALLQSYWWLQKVPAVALLTLCISSIFGLMVWRVRAGTARAALTGALITACLMYANVQYPYDRTWLHGGLLPLLAVFLLTFAATRAGKRKKQAMGLAEANSGRNAAQVSANLGVAAMVVIIGPIFTIIFKAGGSPILIYAAAIAALAEAAADTVSSEIGEVFGGQPRMITTLRRVAPGTDGAITLAGTVAGILAAAIVAGVAAWSVDPGLSSQGRALFWLALPGATFGLLFDSLLGATLERKKWLNNDAVNFISTFGAAIFVALEIMFLATSFSL